MAAPLAGIRVLDFSWVIAGPYATTHLVELGAEVIKVESAQHLDVSRRLPPFADGQAGTERSGHNHTYNAGKKSITLNLGEPEAQELALELVKQSDIVVENYAYGVMEKFNLGYDVVRGAKPDILYVSIGGLGRTGPYREFVTWGPPLVAYSGLASITGLPGQPERDLGGVWADHLGALTALFGTLVALEARERLGVGQAVEVSMSEAVSGQLSEAFAELALTGRPPEPIGNRDPAMCPHGVFPSSDPLEWVALAVGDDDWAEFSSLVPLPSWCLSPEFRSVDARKAREAAIEAAVADWTASQSAAETVQALQARGLSAGKANTLQSLIADPLLAERGFFHPQHHPEVGDRLLAGIGFQAVGTVRASHRAPLLGEHNWEIFIDRLGLSPERFADLVGRNVIA